MYVSIHTVYNFTQALLSLHGQAEYFGQKSATLSDFFVYKNFQIYGDYAHSF